MADDRRDAIERFRTLAADLRTNLDSGSEQELQSWRRRITDAVFYFFSLVGFFAYVPSVALSIREGLYSIAVLSTVLYAYCIAITFLRNVGHLFKAISGSLLFFIVGVVLLYVLGPRGAGTVWLFATTILVALLLGNTGAVVALIANTIIQGVFYFLVRGESVTWSGHIGITSDAWLVSGVNFILVNFAILIAHAVLTAGFKSLVARSVETRNASILGLAKLAEYRDNDTGEHLRRIQQYSVLLAQRLSRQEPYEGYVTAEYIEDLRVSSILHDIGKVGIPDAVLLKPGPLTAEEFVTIKQHPVMGGEVISEIENHIDGSSFYTLGREIARHHHEKWDGSGYPDGLAGDRIPLSARICALADAYDALTSQRVYKEPVSHEDALRIIREADGTHFDPDVVRAFIDVADEFVSVQDLETASSREGRRVDASSASSR